MTINNILNLGVEPLPVNQGGTGTSSLPATGVLVGNGTLPISSLNLTDGQIPIGSTGINPVAAHITGGPGITVTNGPGSVVIGAVGSGDFPFTQVQFVAKGGNDANAGNFMGEPKLTIQAAINALGLSPSVTGLVWVLDAGTYDESLVSTYSFELYAPNASIISNGGDLLTINNSGINTVTTITCWQFGKFSPGGLAVNLLGAQSNLFLHTNIAQGDMYVEGGFVDGNIAQVASSVHVASTGQFGPRIVNAIFMSVTVDPGGTIAGNIQSIISPGNVVNNQYGNQIINGTLAFNPTTSGIVGTTVADNASSGIVGEYFESIIPNSAGILIGSSTVAQDLTSISLPAGDFDIYGNMAFTPSGGANMTICSCWTSLSSATSPDHSLASYLNFSSIASAALTAPYLRVNVSAPTTVYLSCDVTFAGGQVAICGAIYARRAR